MKVICFVSTPEVLVSVGDQGASPFRSVHLVGT